MRYFPRYAGPPLIDQIVSVENLTLAWRRVRGNIKLALRTRSAGTDAVTLHDFEADWTRQMAQLADEIRQGSYRPLPPRRVAIPKRSGGERAIAILAIRDRVAQRAVQQVLEPLFDPFFLDCAYGCRPGLGVPDAIERVQRYADHGLIWVVDADIRSYFDTIDQRIMLQLVRQRIDEVAVLHLLAQWLTTGAAATAESTPITPVTPSLIGRLRQRVQRMIEQTEHPIPLPPAHPLDDEFDSSLLAEMGTLRAPSPHGWENKLWTATMLARPLARGVQTALPYAQRIGGRWLAIAGALAAGTVAAGELLMRHWASAGRGTLQGGSLSPLLANVYLHPFDLALTSQGLRLVRFMDDFVILCRTRDDAEAALAVARQQLETLHLTLNPDKTRILPYADGLEFLGQALAPRPQTSPFRAGLATFTDAEQALRTATGNVRRKLKKS